MVWLRMDNSAQALAWLAWIELGNFGNLRETQPPSEKKKKKMKIFTESDLKFCQAQNPSQAELSTIIHSQPDHPAGRPSVCLSGKV